MFEGWAILYARARLPKQTSLDYNDEKQITDRERVESHGCLLNRLRFGFELNY